MSSRWRPICRRSQKQIIRNHQRKNKLPPWRRTNAASGDKAGSPRDQRSHPFDRGGLRIQANIEGLQNVMGLLRQGESVGMMRRIKSVVLAKRYGIKAESASAARRTSPNTQTAGRPMQGETLSL